MTANGSYQYDPTTSAELSALSSGTVTDSFQYTINDGNGGTSTATVTITVNCVNDAPNATDDTATTYSNATTSGNVLDNDSDVDTGDSLHISAFSVTSAMGASVTVNNDGSFTYNPGASAALKALANGSTVADTFTYTAMDSGGKISTATVTRDRDRSRRCSDRRRPMRAAPTRTLPPAEISSQTTSNTTRATASRSTRSDATSAKGATVTVDAGGNYTYDPSGAAELQALSQGTTTTDTFTYTIEDQQGNTTTATVTITITGVNDESTAFDDTATTNKDMTVTGNVLDNDTDPDADDTLEVTAFDATSAKGAAVTVNSDGSFSYDPTGSTTLQALAEGTTTTDTFTYTMDDGYGNTQTSTVTVTVSGDEGVPIANDDTGTTNENTSLTGNVLDNDQVPTGRTMAVTDYQATTSQGGTVTMQADGSFTYDPTGSDTLNALGAGQSLNDTFTYTITDSEDNSTTATVTITVTGIADAPVISKNTGEIVGTSPNGYHHERCAAHDRRRYCYSRPGLHAYCHTRPRHAQTQWRHASHRQHLYASGYRQRADRLHQ